MLKTGDKVICNDNIAYESRFTEGCVYNVVEGQSDDMVTVATSSGEKVTLFAERFSLIYSPERVVAVATELLAAAEALVAAQARFDAAKAALQEVK